MPLLSLVIPCYNEAENLQALIERCGEMPRMGKVSEGELEVLLVDNGSTDRTAELLPQAILPFKHVRTVRVPINKGYGFGILEGLRAAKGRYLGWTHADLQCDPADVLAILPQLRIAREECYYKGLRKGRKWSEAVFTLGMAGLESALLRTWLWDINAQPNIFPRSFFETLSDPPWDFSLDLYCYCTARQHGLRVQRFPVHFGERRAGQAHLDSLRARLRYARKTLSYSLALRAGRSQR